MTVKNLKPTTAGQRGTVLIDKSHLWKGNSLKSLTVKSISTGGRNNQGRITSRRMGGGAKRKYRIIDFKRNKFDVSCEVIRNEYDPNRSAFISLVKYVDGELRYIIKPQKISVGDKIISSQNAEIKEGNCLPIKNIPDVTNIHNISFRSACAVLSKTDLFIGTEGGMHHAAAALNKKAVVIFGGFIDPSITGYNFHKNIYIKNLNSPCGSKYQCEHCKKCMDLITVDMIIKKINELFI